MVNEKWVVESILELQQGGGGGTTNYNLLNNKPKINLVELIGNKTLEDLGILARNFGVAYAGKVLKVGTDGNVIADTVPGGSAVWGGISGTLSNQTDLMNELNKKVNLGSTSVDCAFGVDSGGIFVEY